MIHFFLSFDTVAYVLMLWAVSLAIAAPMIRDFEAEFNELLSTVVEVTPEVTLLLRRMLYVSAVIVAPLYAIKGIYNGLRWLYGKLF
jgi:hypothetical protein